MNFTDIPADLSSLDAIDLERLAQDLDSQRIRMLIELHARDQRNTAEATAARVDGLPAWAQVAAKKLLGASKGSILLLALAFALVCSAGTCSSAIDRWQRVQTKIAQDMKSGAEAPAP